MKNSNSESVRQLIREGYGKIAESKGSCCAVSCCGSSPEASSALGQKIGYSLDELAALPEGANMGLSCGNPTALAGLKPGEVVLDLGAGGGFDVFIAGRKVGAGGKAIGVDMTAEMIAKARKNIAPYTERTGLDNVEFRLGEIEHLPVADASVDVIISNCVLNLSPDKAQVWREIARVLKPGGRVAVSDLALVTPLPDTVKEMVEALMGCVAGAVLVSETQRMAQEAGLNEIVLNPKSEYIKAMSDWSDPLYTKIIEHLPAGATAADYITSLEVKAVKSGATQNDLYSPEVAELVAIGAAISANCEPCFKYHFNQARQLGVSVKNMGDSVNTALSVKQAPAKAVINLAQRYLKGDFSLSPESDCCPGPGKTEKKSCCQ
jgi:AhpD family alkylhydroperoxidase